MRSLLSDFRFALRLLAKAPGFVCIAVLTLALGIGASSTVLSLAKSLVLDPLSYPEADRLVDVWSHHRFQQPLSAPDFLDLARRNGSFTAMAAFRFERLNLGGDSSESIMGVMGTPQLLPILGVPPALGRWFSQEDGASDTPRAVILSHGLWKSRFGGDPGILGRSLRMNGGDVQIVGVMPEDFLFQAARSRGRDPQIFVPLHLEMNEQRRSSHSLESIARLQSGVSLEQADADIRSLGVQLAQEHPQTNQHKPFSVRSCVRETTQDARSRLPLLLGAVALVLLMACANVASLLLARGSHRQTEFAVRFALGATRGAVIRLCLAESAILTFAGCLGGVVIAAFGVRFLHGVMVVPLPPGTSFRIDSVLLAIGGVLALVTTFIAGLPAALAAARAALFETLKDGGRGHAGSRTRRHFLHQLVAIQILLAFLLLNGAFVLSSSYLKVWKHNGALSSDRTITAGITLKGERFSQGPSRTRFWEQYLERVQALPGVKAAALTTKLPLEGGNNWGVLVEGETYDPAVDRPMVERSDISPGYFEAMAIQLLRGSAPQWKLPETSNASDAASAIRMVPTVVNQAFTQHYWPGQNPLGKRFWGNNPKPDEIYIVVGEAVNVRQWGPEEACIPEMYLPYPAAPRFDAFLVVRGEGVILFPALSRALASQDGDLALFQVRTMERVLGDATRDRRVMMQVINGFMGLAVLLALVGIYGTLSYNIARQQREVGIRMVLGAGRREILGLFLRQLLPVVAVGLVLGVIGCLATLRFVRGFVYQVDPANPWMLAGVALLLLAASAITAWWPAWRSSRMHPNEALRGE
jgi:putative ABC transport system permease protein